MRQCLKCGKKVEEQSVFCSECLAIMEQYPINPGTVVHLPRRQTIPENNQRTDFEEPTQAEQLDHQRKLIRWLTTIVAGLSLLLVITAVMLIRTLDKAQSLPMIGRNYTTSTSAQKP